MLEIRRKDGVPFLVFQFMNQQSNWENKTGEIKQWNRTMEKVSDLMKLVNDLIAQPPSLDPTLPASLNMSMFAPMLEKLFANSLQDA